MAGGQVAGTLGATGSDVLMITEGTYPFVMGGVSTCCHQLTTGIPEVRWDVLALIPPAHRTRPGFTLPPNANLLPPIVVWEEQSRLPVALGHPAGSWVPAQLLRGLLGWEGSIDDVVEALVWCRLHPKSAARAFRSRAAWNAWHEALDDLIREDHPEGGSLPALDRTRSAELYRAIQWIARVAAVPTPPTHVLHVTAAGWAAVPALVHKALEGTPIVLTEHGVYVREAYLAHSDGGIDDRDRAVATRLARGLSRAAYAHADVIAPVTDFNASWERGLGVEESRIHPIVNGIRVPRGGPTAPPGTKVVTSVGRIDPLKDVKTMLQVASEVIRLVPDCRFVHRGPVSPGQEAYAEACQRLHEQLGLGDRFVFAGPTHAPLGAVREADVVLLTSISEGLPMSILEAMAEARPVVATKVGGVPEVLHGVGIVQPPGAVHALAGSVAFLLRNPTTAAHLGLLGRNRVAESYSGSAHLAEYRRLLGSHIHAGAAA